MPINNPYNSRLKGTGNSIAEDRPESRTEDELDEMENEAIGQAEREREER